MCWRSPCRVDFAKFRAIVDEVGAILMADIADDAAPFSLRTLWRGQDNDAKSLLGAQRHGGVPCIQGGPDKHQMSGLGAQLLEVRTPEFVKCSKAWR